jgi:hypothetical protein
MPTAQGVCAIGEHQRSATVPNCLDDIRHDLLVSLVVGHQCSIDVVNYEIRDLGRHPETSLPRYDQVLKRRTFGSLTSAQVESDRSALHEDNRMMAVLASRRRGQANDKLRLDLPHHLFETEGGQVMALVGNHLPVLGNTVLYFTFTVKALKQGHVDQSVVYQFEFS